MKRSHLAYFVVAVGAMLIAAPLSLGASPVRTVVIPGPGVWPAGFGCPFDVGRVPNDVTRITEFSGGRTVFQVNAEPTLTNLETGTAYIQRSRFTATDTYDPDANDVLSVTSGRFIINFFPGDQGPFGKVGESGALFAFAGRVQTTFDLDTEIVISFSYEGTVTDLCGVLSVS
jgi:hypothetical protein